MPTIHAFAHRVNSFSGHPYTYHLSCQQAFLNLGVDYYVYSSLNCDIPALPDKWRKWFPTLCDKSFFRRQARRLVRIAPGERRIFFIETFVRRDLRLFILSLLQYGRSTDAAWILFRDDHIWKRGRDRRCIKLWISLLRLKFGERVHFFTDSDKIGQYLGKKLGVPFTVLPLPNLNYVKNSVHHAGGSRLLFVGEPREEKGAAFIRQMAYSADPERHVFQLTCSELMQLESATMTVHSHSHRLDHEAYCHLLQSHDVILLPYSAYRYKRRTSGIFVEAICLGKIPIVKEGTWMSEELKQFGLAELILDFEPSTVFTKLKKILADPTLESRLKAMQKAYETLHQLETFQDCFRNILNRSSDIKTLV